MPPLFRLALRSTAISAAISAACLAVVAAAVPLWLAATAVTADTLPPLKNGDIVFQDSGGGQGLAIMFASRSAYTHTGLIEIAPDGTPLVVEAAGPVRTVPLSDWIGHGRAGRITIKRLPSLSAEDAARVLARAHSYDGRPYDIFFLDSRDAIYCSELVHAAFAEGIGTTIGRIEKFRDLAIDNIAARSLIAARWQKYPPCQARGVTSFEACRAIILEQPLVTPASIARDPKLEMIYSNFGPIGD